VTLGADGVVIGCRDENGGEPVHLPAFRVPNVVDTCGAGDLFHGAFLWAYREGRSVLESATFAQAAVALRIQHYGNVAGQPTREQVEAFLKERHPVSGDVPSSGGSLRLGNPAD
jgi:sugar/nucleoside kinase (ribokinase family)